MQCNLCEGTNLEKAITVPNLPISKDYSGSSYRFDLNLHYCHACGLLQICEPIPPNDLYGSEFYLTGFHRPKHIDDLVACALHYKDPGKIIEIGCNDGSILRDMKSLGFTHFAGIEPNTHAAEKAAGAGVIYHDYLTVPLAKQIAMDNGLFDFVLCRHVIEHVSNLKDFFSGIDALLSADGILIVEFPHIEIGFDSTSPTILFEEHVNHFTEPCLIEMFRFFGFEIVERRYYTFGGGSIALVCKRADRLSINLESAKSKSFSYYQSYAQNLANLRERTIEFIEENKDHDIVLYGAASRSAMFINVMGVANKIDYVFDDRKELHGLIMPGTGKVISAPIPTPREAVALLGVGSENEWRMAKNFSKTLSLFPPRFGGISFSA